MTVNDVLAECPKDKCYQRTDELCWFIGQASPIDEEKRILAQRMVSVFHGVPDVWVALPEILLANAGGEPRGASPRSVPPPCSDWIPVSERLPEHVDYVLVWCDDYTPEAGVCAIDSYMDAAWCQYTNVTHWQPLPVGPNAEAHGRRVSSRNVRPLVGLSESEGGRE